MVWLALFFNPNKPYFLFSLYLELTLVLVKNMTNNCIAICKENYMKLLILKTYR